ncbi:MAG: NAD(P)H-binding protein [Furfurilactobacillus sp.]|jgi:putative NADH-flavin reductase|uniref:NAD(P)-dependent oxidoreductase n=1 Tax=Furfurilactobacillus TaxID=2767882 RepID=UPI001F25D0C7|nr:MULTISPECIES: NAD(P)H-binding protein [Furfurilactobacillus]MCF6418511.1 NAD(P)H-binding protein [Furfurilactobacillus milii]MCH4012008.1 NAD(P)H-binding protein [Furfurilactobacillus sp.]MCH4037900.1 NAD(P)H-binding protein [Furfurilactobacillus sp.]MCH4115463.1 NAD(P)H-binding protein [Furfurilactobacillus sp.]MCI1341326.1 NAD(P)H-binding protein [Furfurilactobacillus sp.]
MKVIIFGATGGIGKYALKHSLQKGYTVTAYVRNPDKVQIKDSNLTIVQGEITDNKSMKTAMQGQDAVIWCIGIPLKRKYETMASLESHKILLTAMREYGVKRLIDWGTPSVPFKKDKKSFITVVPGILAGIGLTTAKKEMIEIGKLVQESNLNWTIVRFMAPKNASYTNNVKVGFGDTKMNFAISREDIGAFMVEQLESKKYINSMPIIGS